MPIAGVDMNEGDVGRDVGVDIELDVDTVLMLSRPSPSADARDCGRPAPLCFASPKEDTDVLELDDRLVLIEEILNGEGEDVGLDNRRRAFSASFFGDGVRFSSMISTHPQVSALPVLGGGSFESSALILFSFLGLSGVLKPPEADARRLSTAAEASAFLAVELTIRRRGTRVCNLCSKLRTLARISDTI